MVVTVSLNFYPINIRLKQHILMGSPFNFFLNKFWNPKLCFAIIFWLGRAYLFDQCVNVTTGTAEDRLLITGMHSVCDIFCNRCRSMVGWTYARAYEPSQKYKEGKFIIEKINLHLEESDAYDVCHPAGERHDKWRRRSMSWGSESPVAADLVYEYKPKPALLRARSGSIGKTGNSPGGLNAGSPPLRAESVGTSSVSPSINMSGRNIKSPPTSHADRPWMHVLERYRQSNILEFWLYFHFNYAWVSTNLPACQCAMKWLVVKGGEITCVIIDFIVGYGVNTARKARVYRISCFYVTSPAKKVPIILHRYKTFVFLRTHLYTIST